MAHIIKSIAILAATTIATVTSVQCGHKINTTNLGSWTTNAELKASFLESGRRGIVPPTVTVDLDLPPEERWLHVGKAFANKSDLIIDYFESAIPEWAMGILADLGAEVVDYKGFGDFSGEMKGYAEGLGLDLGYVVAANLVYQIERIGVNCSNWNATGPTNACKKKSGESDPIVWLSSALSEFRRATDPVHAAGFCTSVVANEPKGAVLHGRNLDWNLPEEVRDLVITVRFEKGGKLLYYGSTIVSYVGILNGMKPDDGSGNGFTFSMDARCQGGRLFFNLLEALAEGAMTPCQHSRVVMESANDFESAVKGWEDGKLIDDGYFIVGGSESGQGAVVSRDRNWNADTWYIDQNTAGGRWYVLETNYDHWDSPPTADDRRTPALSNMNQLGQANMSPATLFSDIMTIWPTFNPHTDLTCIMSANKALYNCSVWLDE